MKRAQSGYIVDAGFFRDSYGRLCKTNPGLYMGDGKQASNSLNANPGDVLPKKAYNVIRNPSKL